MNINQSQDIQQILHQSKFLTSYFQWYHIIPGKARGRKINVISQNQPWKAGHKPATLPWLMVHTVQKEKIKPKNILPESS